MKRDRMRLFAWVLVTIGVLLWGLGAVRAIQRVSQYDQMVEIWQTIRALDRHIVASGGTPPGPLPPYPATPWEVFGAGLLLGAFPFAFGVLILAIRRPAPQGDVAKPSLWAALSRGRQALNRLAFSRREPIPKATVVALPPWEKR